MTFHRRTFLGALWCALAFGATPAGSASPGSRGEPKGDPRVQELGEQAAEVTMRILRAQAHLLDMQEALGGPVVIPARKEFPDARRGSPLAPDEVLAVLALEVASLENLLDSRRQVGGLAIVEEWSTAALLQHPGDRGLFKDDADHRAALFRLADALREQHLWRGARSYYERLMTPPSKEAPIAMTRAMECGLRLGDFPGVVDMFLGARRRSGVPGTDRSSPTIPPEAIYLAGTAAFRRTDLPPGARDAEALQILGKVPPPFDVPAAYHRGALLVRAGDLDRATQEFEACDRLSATAPRHQAQQEMCWLALARIDGHRWPWDLDRFWYRQVPRESPHFQVAVYEQAYNLNWAGVDEIALPLVEGIVAKDPESLLAGEADLLRAGILSRLGRHRESVEAYDRIRRDASTMRDQLDQALRAERGPAAYLELFTGGPGRGDHPEKVPPAAIRRARASAEVAQALEAWGVLVTATQALAQARASSDRLDATVSRDERRPHPGIPGVGAGWTGTLAAAVQDLDARVAAEEAGILGNADSPDQLTDPRRDLLRTARGLRLRLDHLGARARRNEKTIVALSGSGDRRPPAELVEEQRDLADAQRQLHLLRTEAQEVLGLQVHRVLLDVRAQLDRTVLECDRGIVEVALARTKDAERRVERLVFRREFEASLPPGEARPAVLADLEARGREAEAEGRKVREEAIAQLGGYVRRHEDDPVYTPQALSRLAELQVERAEGSPSRAPARARAPASRRVVDSGLEVTPSGCASVVDLHQRLLKGFPSYRQRDAVYFLAGYCLGEMGRVDDARQAYLDLIRKYPDSPHVSEAWVRIGDLGFEDGRPDALRSAAEAYAKAAGQPDRPLYEHATYMLGWTRYRLDDLPGAVEILRTLLDRQFPAGSEVRGDVPPGAVQLLGSVLADPRWDGVAQARVLFAAGRGRSYEAAVHRRLADELFEQGRYAQAVEAYEVVLARAPLSPDAPKIQERIVLSWSREGRPREEALERERLIATYDESSEWARRNRGAGARTGEARDLVEASRSSAAVALHARASELERAGKGPAAMAEYRRAAQAYAAILLATPGVKGAEGMEMARAECTFGAGEYEAAARLYDAARDASVDPGRQLEAAHGAVRSWEAEVARQREAGRLQGREPPIPAVLRSLVSAADALVARFPGDELAPAAALRAGEIHYGYQDQAEARRRLEEVAARWPGSEVGKRASRLVVESHIASKDWAAGEAAASQFRRQALPGDAAFVSELQRLELASRFQRATELMAQKKWGEASAIFQAIADEAPRHPLADKALFNAAISQEADRHLQAAFALFGRVASEHPDSPFAAESLFRQASVAEATFDFARAAERYQFLLEKYPGSKQMRDALFNRARTLEILQRYEESGLAFERHASMSPVGPDAPATLLHAVEVFEKGAAWQRVVQAFQNFQRRHPKAGDPEQVVVAHVRAGRAENALGHAEAARASYSRAVSEFDRRGLEPAANPAGAAAAAEARFRLVENDLQRFDPTALPSTSQASKLERALKAQLAETNKLSTRYEEVKRFRSPDWTVAATYRQGYLADRFARTLHDAPIPPEFKKAGQEEYLAAYREQLATFARPYEEQAVEAYTRASRLAQELRVESEWSRRVAERLAQLPRAKGRYLPDDPPRPDEQEQRARNALSEGAPDVAALVDLANVALARRRIELARAILARAQEVAPDDATVWNALGRVDLALEARMKAEARWKKAIELTPGYADALTNHGQLLVEAGDFAGAAALLEQAVRSAPSSAPSWLDLGNAYRGMARFDDAVRAYERALALDAMLVDARSNLELLRREAARPTGGVP